MMTFKKTATIRLCSLFVSMSFLGLLSLAGSAWALGLQEAKAQGLVGELQTGYLGAIKSGPEVQALVDEINQARRQQYTAIAKRNGTSVAVVEALAGKKAIEKASPGEYVQDPSGAWVQKK